MGSASAYAVLRSIDKDVDALLATHPSIFTFADREDGVVDIRDFQTTGVVAFARGCPFYSLPSGRLAITGQRVVKEEYRLSCVQAMEDLAATL